MRLRHLLHHTPSILRMDDFLKAAVTHDLPVLLTGETGSGKTYLARLIHDCSPRRDNPLLVVPCGALVPSLIGSELFGHAKGAFTGADRAMEGKFSAVGQGTILLDEIDTLGLAQQSNLLRILETGEYEPVGSTQTQICRARMVFASNLNLEEAVERGKFRMDLYYRINVLSFYLPPLRERVEDIMPLVEGAIERAREKFRKGPMGVHPEARAALEAYPWPGNIRQLENVVQNATLFCNGPEILLKHLPKQIQEYAFQHLETAEEEESSLGLHCEQHERALIQRTLLECDFNCTVAARTLKVSRTTLYKKIKKYGLMGGEGMYRAGERLPDAKPAGAGVRELIRSKRYRTADPARKAPAE
jgi:DNA-binding NtrC family response regulator